jgi:hypothetical protein
MSDNKTLIILAGISLMAVIVAAPMVAFSQQQTPQSNGQSAGGSSTDDNLTTFEAEAQNATSDGSNTTTTNETTSTGGNATTNETAAPTANATVTRQQLEQQRMTLTDDYRKNITSGDTKVLIVTVSSQRGVPIEHENRDIDPLGVVVFENGGSMRIDKPSYASGENATSNLYPGGRLSFVFQNQTILAPDDIDVTFISKDANDMRSPIVIDDRGSDNEFRVPDGLKVGQSYLVLVSMHYPDLHHDVLLGIDGKAMNPTPQLQ